MGDLSKILSKPQGIIRLVTTVFCVLGAIGATPGLLYSNINLHYMRTIDITLGGGGLVALSLLLAGSDDENNSVAEISFTLIYMLLSITATIIIIIFMTSDGSYYDENIGIFIMAVCAVGAFITWTVDFALTIKDNCC